MKHRYFVFFLLLLPFSQSVSGQEKPLFTFGVMTDVQYADRDNAGSRYYRSSIGKLDEAVKVFNRENVAFVLHLGDFINDKIQSFDTLLQITGRLQMPFYLLSGNHEFGVNPGEKAGVMKLMGLAEQSYRSFSRDGWRFLLLDGYETGVRRQETGSREYEKNRKILENMKSAGAVNAFDWNGGMSNKQIRWMKRNLNNAGRKEEKVILCCHWPLTPENTPELMLNTPEVKAIIEKYPPVFAWLNGHVHVSRLDSENGVNYVSFRGMVEKEANAFSIVSVYKDHLDIKGYGEEVSRVIRDN